MATETDLSLDNFDFEDAANWLNDQLLESSHDDQILPLNILESKLSNLIRQLDAACSETSFQVDRTIEEISRSVPRLTFDLQLMREHALLLRFTLDGIRKKAPSVTSLQQGQDAASQESTASDVLDRLQILDTLKTRLEASRDVLREAESWSTLDSEVTAYIAEQAYSKAADRLAEATKSMVVFEHTPEFEARRALMISLQNSLEASLSNSLIKAINGRDVKACQTYYGLFHQIQRETEYRNYYYGLGRSSLIKKWQQVELTDCQSSTMRSLEPMVSAHQQEPTTLAEFLSTFFSELADIMEQERAYIPQIFPNPLATISSFLQSTLDALIPSLHQRLAEMADVRGAQFLPELIKCYHAAEEFAVKADRMLNQLVPLPSPFSSNPPSAAESPVNGLVPASSATTPTSKEKRRLSKRYSMSGMKRQSTSRASFSSGSSGYFNLLGDTSVDSENARAWEIALFEPFLDFQVEYATLEKRYSTWILQDTFGDVLAIWLDLGESNTIARQLIDQFTVVVNTAEDATSRSVALAHGHASFEYLNAIESSISHFLSTHTSALIKANAGRQSTVKTRPNSTTIDDTVSLEGLDYSAEDWFIFQLGLKLLSTCRTINSRLDTLDNRLKTRLASLAHSVHDISNDIAPGTTRGALALLKQSTLHSAELAVLFDSLSMPSTKQTIPPKRLLTESKSAATDLAKACQLLLHDTILRPLVAALSLYATLPVWASAANSRQDLKSAFDLDIPTFSLSPTDIISRLGEGLFNLPRLFDVYADDEALAVSIDTLPHVEIAPSMLQINGSHAVLPNKRHSSYGEQPEHTQSSAKKEVEQSRLPAEVVIATWLTSLTTAVLVHLTSNVLTEIKALSNHGSAQLASDLSHLSNVAKALDVETEEVERWRECVEMSDAEGRKLLTDFDQRDAIYNRVARLRGWSYRQ